MSEPAFVPSERATWPLRESRVDHVCVFREGAEVTRTVSLAAGDTCIRVQRLPLDLLAHELRVEVDAGTVRAFHLEAEEHDKNVAVFADQAELDAAIDQLTENELALEDARALQKRVGALGIPERPAPVQGSPPRPAPDQARLELFDLRAEAYTAARVEIQKLVRESELLTQRVRTLTAAKDASGRAVGEVTQRLYVELDAPSQTTLRLIYRVRPAKWAPSYRFFYERKTARALLVMRALVAQRSGEDWTAARISVSTALPSQWAELPELASLRVGRAQPPVKASGFRTLPEDSNALFSDYDRAFQAMREEPTPPREVARKPSPSPMMPMSYAMPVAAPASRPMAIAPPGPMPPGGPMPVGAPVPQAPPPAAKGGVLGGMFGGGGAAPIPAASIAMPKMAERARASVAMEDAEASESYADEGSAAAGDTPARGRVRRPQLNFIQLRLDAPGGARRGRLQPAHLFGERAEALARVGRSQAHAERFLQQLEPPPGLAFPEDAYGFDFQYDAIDRTDVPRDGTFHAIAVAEGNANAQLVHVAVPREDANVYRTFTLANPIEGAVLRGPVDIFFDGVLALTSSLSPTPAQGTLRMGAGIDEQVRVARNVRYSEETSGLMGGWTHLQHAIEIEIRNNGNAPITLELRERVPVTSKGEKEIEVRYGASSIGWTDLEQAHEPEGAAVLEGGRKARMELAPSAVETVRYDYAIRIATANELVGGNRRD